MGFSKSDDDISTVTSSQFTKARLSLATPFILWGLPIESESEVAQSCRTLCNPRDCSLLGFSAHGIFQARVPEWVAISFSRAEYLTSNFIEKIKVIQKDQPGLPPPNTPSYPCP